MLEYSVSYYLGDMCHSYLVDAGNEFEATEKVLSRIPKTSQYLFNGLKIERFSREWN